MDVIKQIFWFCGFLFGLLSTALAATIGNFIIVCRNVTCFINGSPETAHLETDEIRILIVLAIMPMILVTMWNTIKYYLGQRDFIPEFNGGNPTKTSKDKRKAMSAEVPKEYLSRNPDGFTVGIYKKNFVRIPVAPNEIRHCLILGSPGSMKSTTILNPLIWNFNRAGKKEKMTVFAVDIKPELQRKSVTYDPEGEMIRVINPASLESIYFGWDVYYGLDQNSTDDQVEERADMIARSLINCKEGTENEIFYATARNLMIAFLIYGYVTGKGFLDSMLQLMSVPLQDLITQILADSETVKKHPKLKMMLLSYDGDDSEMLKDSENTMREKLRIFTISSVQYALRDNPQKASPIDLIKGTSIFLALPDHLLKQYRPLFNLMVQQTLNYLSSIHEWQRSDTDCQPIWLLIDEFGSMGHIDIEGALARLRSRKVMIWLCAQGLSQLDDTYGQAGRRSIVTDCDITLIFSSKDDVANKYFSAMSGHYRETKHSYHRDKFTRISDKSQNISQEYRPVFEEADFARLKKDKKLVAFIDGRHIYVDKLPYFKIPELLSISEKIKQSNDQMLKEGENNGL